MVNSSKGLSASQVAKRYEITRKTAWIFMHKVRRAMKSSESYPLTGIVQVDEFAVGGKEEGKQGRSFQTNKKKVISAVELTDEGKIRRMYSLRINDYKSKSLKRIFEKHISTQAQIFTDKWKGYLPLKSEYNITQHKSMGGTELKQLHTMIHQLKSWLRTVFSWVHAEHIDSYMDEFSFRINRSIFKETIFHNLLQRAVKMEHISYKQIIIANK